MGGGRKKPERIESAHAEESYIRLKAFDRGHHPISQSLPESVLDHDFYCILEFYACDLFPQTDSILTII